MADVLDDVKYDCCYLAARALIILVLLKYVFGYSDCGYGSPKELRATSNEQYIKSPNYGSKYPNGLNCKWHISAENSSQYIVVKMVDSYIEDHANCGYDFLRIYDGPSTWSRILGTFCGTDMPEEKSSGPSILLWFHTDSSVSYKGFALKYYSASKHATIEKSDSREKEGGDNEVEPEKHTTVIVGGVVGGVLCSVLLIVFVCVCATTKKCQCCRKPRRTVHPNGDLEETRPGRRSHPRIDDIHGSSTPSPVESFPMQEFPIFIQPSAPPPPYLDSYGHPPEEPYPLHDISFYRLPSSPPPPYSITDPHPNIYSVPNYIPYHHAPLRRY